MDDSHSDSEGHTVDEGIQCDKIGFTATLKILFVATTLENTHNLRLSQQKKPFGNYYNPSSL